MGRIKPTHRGDTIVEVLIAIAIASFAIGISYATAQRSLQQAITARERNEALNIMENQLADLKLRFQDTTSDSFTLNFAKKTNYCLLDSASDPNASNWQPYFNSGPNGPPSQTAPLALTTDAPQGPYNASCKQQRTGDGVAYYSNITTTQNSGALVNPTLYQVTVRWERIGGGQTNQASLFYKLNSAN